MKTSLIAKGEKPFSFFLSQFFFSFRKRGFYGSLWVTKDFW